MHFKIGLRECAAVGMLLAIMLLFLYVRENKQSGDARLTAAWGTEDHTAVQNGEEPKEDRGKIALTFEYEVIIGLSQEVLYK